MDDIDRYLNQICSGLGGSKALRCHFREELREHIIEAVEKYRADGLEQEVAVQKALDDFGQPETLCQELQGVYGRHFVSLLIDKAMQWKEKSMKTGWKWTFGAHIALALVIVLQVFFVMVSTMIFPHVVNEYDMLEAELPGYARSVLSFLRILDGYWIVWVIPLALIWTIFEWKCRSENKSRIRLACGALIALGMGVLVWAVSIATVIPLAQLSGLARRQHPESAILGKVVEADAQFKHLSEAIERQDWPVVRQSAHELQWAFEWLERRGSSAPTLVAMDKREDFDNIRQLFENIAGLSDDISDSIRDMEDPELAVPHYFSQLEESYKQLKAKAPGMSRALKQ